jgi:hypothetical protein
MIRFLDKDGKTKFVLEDTDEEPRAINSEIQLDSTQPEQDTQKDSTETTEIPESK